MLVPVEFGYGAWEAEQSLRTTASVYRIEQKNSSVINVTLLRSLEKGVLAWDPGAQRATLVRWEQIERISHFAALDEEPPLACRYLGFFCPETEP